MAKETAYFSPPLELIADAIPALVSYIDASFRYVFVNSRYAEWFGLAARDVVGKTMEEVLGREAFLRLQPFTARALAGEPLEFERELPYRHGTTRFVHVSYRPHVVEEHVAGIVAVARDVTSERRDHERIEESLARETEARAQAQRAAWRSQLLEQVGTALSSSMDYDEAAQRLTDLLVRELVDWAAVVVVTPDGNLLPVGVSAASAAHGEIARRYRGRSYPAPRGRRGMAEVLRSGRTELIDTIEDAFLTENIEPEFAEILRRVEVVAYAAVPLKARGQTIGGLLLAQTRPSGRRLFEGDLPLVEEIAARAAVAMDNARLLREAQEANRLKDDFLVTLSHELRTPLNAILGWAQLMEQGGLDADGQLKAVQTIVRNARTQERLVADILDLSRILSGKLSLHRATVDLVSIVRHALESIRPLAAQKDIELLEQLESNELVITGDAARLEQILWNLLHNAIKFTPPGGVVTVSLSTAGGDAEITVSDTGRGISPEFLPLVFDRFQQEERRRHSPSGLGVGLAIVRHLVELHRGQVRAASSGVGRGTAFTVRLPLAMPSAYRPGSGEPANGTLADLTGISVVVVDPAPDYRELATYSLRQAGADVRECATAALAIDGCAAADRAPDLVLWDLGAGIEALADLRSTLDALPPGRRRTKIAAVSPVAAELDRHDARDAGCDHYLLKPTQPAEIVEQVAALVES